MIRLIIVLLKGEETGTHTQVVHPGPGEHKQVLNNYEIRFTNRMLFSGNMDMACYKKNYNTRINKYCAIKG